MIGGNRLAQALLATGAPGVPSLSLPQFGVIPPNPVERATGVALDDHIVAAPAAPILRGQQLHLRDVSKNCPRGVAFQ
jgi:hypothetical protein